MLSELPKSCLSFRSRHRFTLPIDEIRDRNSHKELKNNYIYQIIDTSTQCQRIYEVLDLMTTILFQTQLQIKNLIKI